MRQDSDALAVSVYRAVDISSLSRPTLYRAMKQGRLPFKKIGRRRLILVEDLDRFLKMLPAA